MGLCAVGTILLWCLVWKLTTPADPLDEVRGLTLLEDRTQYFVGGKGGDPFRSREVGVEQDVDFVHRALVDQLRPKGSWRSKVFGNGTGSYSALVGALPEATYEIRLEPDYGKTSVRELRVATYQESLVGSFWDRYERFKGLFDRRKA